MKRKLKILAGLVGLFLSHTGCTLADSRSSDGAYDVEIGVNKNHKLCEAMAKQAKRWLEHHSDLCLFSTGLSHPLESIDWINTTSDEAVDHWIEHLLFLDGRLGPTSTEDVERLKHFLAPVGPVNLQSTSIDANNDGAIETAYKASTLNYFDESGRRSSELFLKVCSLRSTGDTPYYGVFLASENRVSMAALTSPAIISNADFLKFGGRTYLMQTTAFSINAISIDYLGKPTESVATKIVCGMSFSR
jgi:hypothetical protein